MIAPHVPTAAVRCLQALVFGLAATAAQAQTDEAASRALRLELGDRARLQVAPRPDRQAWVPQDVGRPQQTAALGLEFASAPSDGPQRLLRVQLSGDSMLNFRPRGGGLSVTYRSKF